MLVIFSISNGIIKRVIDWQTTFIATQVEDSWCYSALNHLLHLPLQYHDTINSSEVASSIERGGSSIWNLIHIVIGQELLVSTFSLVSVLALTLYTVPQLWWAFLPPIPIFLVLNTWLSSKEDSYDTMIGEYWDEASSTFHDSASNVRIAAAFSQEQSEVRRFALKRSTSHYMEYKREELGVIRQTVQTVTQTIMFISLVIYSYLAITQGDMTIGTFTMLIAYQNMIMEPLCSLTYIIRSLQKITRECTPIFDLMKRESELIEREDAEDAPPLKTAITISNCSFTYKTRLSPEDEDGDDDSDDSEDKQDPIEEKDDHKSSPLPALINLNIVFKRGTTTGVVGRSGAGKSTLIMHLMRFYDPDSGTISWDGIPLPLLSLRSIRRQIAIVPQETSLFDRTIAENICYGNPDASPQSIINAAKMANAHDFIMETPNGYNTLVGERGICLSGGQRQRIGIARALIMDPSLLILDESTSNLDSESEKAIQTAIHQLHHKVTQVIIAHRLSTVIHADQIVVMDKGTVIDVGSHSQLIRSCPLYKKLYDIQRADSLRRSQESISTSTPIHTSHVS